MTQEKALRWLFFAATLSFCAATFQIVDGHWPLAVICFAAAAGVMVAAGRVKRAGADRESLSE